MNEKEKATLIAQATACMMQRHADLQSQLPVSKEKADQIILEKHRLMVAKLGVSAESFNQMVDSFSRETYSSKQINDVIREAMPILEGRA